MPDPIRGSNPLDVLGISPPGQSGSPQAPASIEPKSGLTPVDSADLSRAEGLLTTISRASSAIPTVDPARVAELQQALNSGTYQANPQLIAENIMKIEALLSGAGKGN
jgi:negative regulator of flagellin synthesis FlgM